MVNEHISWWRRRKGTAVVPVEEPPEPAAGGGHEEGVVRRVALERALAQLTRKQRAVLVLRFYDDMSEAETAAMLGCPKGPSRARPTMPSAGCASSPPSWRTCCTTATRWR